MYVADMAGDKPRTERVPLLLTAEEVQELDDWQFSKRMRTRSDAIRELMKLGYAAAADAKNDGDKP